MNFCCVSQCIARHIEYPNRAEIRSLSTNSTQGANPNPFRIWVSYATRKQLSIREKIAAAAIGCQNLVTSHCSDGLSFWLFVLFSYVFVLDFLHDLFL